MAAEALTPKQERFVELVLAGANQTDAYRQAYDCKRMADKSIFVNACKLRANAKVAQRLALIQHKATEVLKLDRAWVLERLMRNASICLGETKIKLMLRARDGKVVEVDAHRPNPEAANKALELLGKEIGLFIERSEVGQPGEFAELKDDALREAMVKEAQSLGFTQVAKMIKSAMVTDAEVVDAEGT